MTDEKFEFTSGAKRKIFITLGAGLVLFVLGLIIAMNSGHGHGDEAGHAMAASQEQWLAEAGNGHAADVEKPKQSGHGEGHDSHAEAGHGEGHGGHHGSANWLKRLYANLWINNIYFTGLAIIGLFFIAIQYAAQAGWSAGIKRVPLAMASWLPIASLLTVVVWFLVQHDLFHWTHLSLYDENGPGWDPIINGKKAFFFWPLQDNPSFPVFYILRMV